MSNNNVISSGSSSSPEIRNQTNEICCSAPGKVLMTGGYLVLERPNKGLVLTVDARFYTSIKPISEIEVGVGKRKREEIEGVEFTDSNGPFSIIVESPQFHHVQEYKLLIDPKRSLRLELLPENVATFKPNPYTENSLIYTLHVIRQITLQDPDKEKYRDFIRLLKGGLKIKILGDNAFYSQREQLKKMNLGLSLGSLIKLPPLLITSFQVDKISKTGLGSSAALVTSLIAALLAYFKICKLPKRRSSNNVQHNLQLLHNLSQFCHCVAQGKIGSGFDISSAVYGSQFYVRFSKEIIQSFLNPKEFSSPDFLNIINSTWDGSVTKFTLPKGMFLLLGDVGSAGSNTPNMVSKVLQWKTDSSISANFRWSQLAKANGEVEKEFASLNEMSNFPNYLNNIRKCGTLTPDQWLSVNSEVADSLVRLRNSFLLARQHLRAMGNDCNVEIEPESQELLCNETMNLPGVLIAGVPGAGGYDAIFAILIHKEAFKPVETLWSKHNVLPLLLKEDSSGICKEDNSPSQNELS